MLSESVTVFLFFTGTVAFVPERPDSNRVEAFLMNVEGHEQLLLIPLDRLRHRDRDCIEATDNPRPLCSRVDRFCVCDLRREVDTDSITEISLLTRSGEYMLPDRPPAELNGTTVGDIGWLANMKYVKPRAATIDRNMLKGNVGTRIEFGWAKAATCLFEEVRCEKQDGTPYRKIFDIEFDDWLDPIDENHPVAELVVFQATTSAGPTVRFRFVRNGDPMEQSLELKADGKSCPILLYNSMYAKGDSKFLCEECDRDSDRSNHFRFFGKITGDVNGVGIHRQCGADDYKELPIVFPEICKDMKVFDLKAAELKSREAHMLLPGQVITLGDRIICPAAVLSN